MFEKKIEKEFLQMATPTPEELDKQLDDFIDKLIEDKDQLPKGELDAAFWKVSRTITPYFLFNLLHTLGSRKPSILSERNARRWCGTSSSNRSVTSIALE